MRKPGTAVLAGVAALAVAGAVLAANHDMHRLNVGLPDGSVASIEYEGDVAPRISIATVPRALPAGFVDGFDNAPFGAFDRIAAEIDRQAGAMIHVVSALQAAPISRDGMLDLAGSDKLPAGAIHYRFFSTNGNSRCDRSIEVTSYGSGRKPKVILSNSGDCRSEALNTAARAEAPVHPSVPAPTKVTPTPAMEGPDRGPTA